MLEDLRRVTVEAREHPQEFAEYLNSKQSAELQKEIRRLEKEKAAMQKRKVELDAIFKKLYEDSVLGRITAEQFQMLSASYTDEQAKLTEALPQREAEIQRLKETVSNTAAFLDKAKRYGAFQWPCQANNGLWGRQCKPLRCRCSFLKFTAEILAPKKNLPGILPRTGISST